MNLSYETDLMRNCKDRQSFRNVLQEAGLWLLEQSPLDQLREGKDVPASKVLPQLLELLDASIHGSALFRLSASEGPRAEDLRAFIDYVKGQVAMEAVQAKMARLVKEAAAAGYTYSTIQTMVVQTMDAFLVKNPKALGQDYGWGN